MNQNFVGQPNAEDIRALEGLRRGLVPMIAAMDKLRRDMDMAASRGVAVDWPQIQRTTTSVNSYITTLNTFINGGRKHTAESRKTDAGKVLKNKQGNEEVRYSDITIPPQADTLRNLHAFPIAPFPGTNEHLSGLTQTLLRKRLEPTEEKWAEDRLAKALEFAKVPPEWGIEPRKPAEKDDKDVDSEVSADQPSTAVGRFSKRAKGTLSEEQLVQRWNSAHTWFFNPPQTSFDEGDDYASGEEGEDDEEEEDFEDAMDIPAADVPAQATQGEEARPAAPPSQIVMIQEAQPPVHKPVPGMPVLDLGVIQKFMATGHL
ncbi:hypothetical protein C7974DRAFT_399573 [Boeremia exigua]|uniref:uncharacterized protein n=1 Tax=Boeremia exigua TaxID=749465 RepID=UPI001E8E7924|nr:uncharacterized protein C7974DRAFT_399573 [Boeremia exigua]KAH6620370.1 hypothetical protein C7974DRAFT_399573 [Boeremia exigua]